MTVLPGPVRQIGYVVTDLDQAIAGWLELGVGPWFVLRGLPLRADYRGEPCETTLSLASANSGEMQIELIRQMDTTPSIFTELTVTDEKASLTSTRSTSSIVFPALSSARAAALAGVRAR